MARKHRYRINVPWTGNTGKGTTSYRSYDRSFEVTVGTGKPVIPGSADPLFRGDKARWNPEELFLASIASCHQLWYLHLCAVSGIVVTAYVDHAEGELDENEDCSGQFQRVVLRPHITIAAGDKAKALALHQEAHAMCFIANSVNFPIEHDATIILA
jgi:organic hydroperoxide reductase OsmC/OhrA